MNDSTETQTNATVPMASPRAAAVRPSRAWMAAVGMLTIVHLALGAHCAWRSTVTHDEYWHLPAGLNVATTGRFNAENLNPPLSRVWSALPLAALGVHVGESSEPNDSTALGDHFLIENFTRYHELYAYGRLMNLIWSALAGWLIAVWGRELYGAGAGILGSAMWFLCPIVLSNAALVTPDVCTAFFFLANAYAAWRFAREPTVRGGLILGLLLGLAQLAKFTCVLLYPIAIVVWFVVRCRGGLPAVTCRRAVGSWALTLATSVFVLNAGYLFQGSGQPLKSYQFLSRGLARVAEAAGPLGGLPVPAPRDYVVGFDRQRSIMEAIHPVYLDGQMDGTGNGFRDYYFRACAYKWPHPIQALVVTAVCSGLFLRAGRRLWRSHFVLLLPAGLVVGIASASHMQLGIRYMLPAFPLIYLFAGHVGAWLAVPRWNWGKAWVGLCLFALLLGLRYHPHHLAYFNELSGGPVGGPTHLLDSNIDWGQDLRELHEYLNAQKVESVSLAYFGMVPPARLGFNYQIPPSFKQVHAAGGLPGGWYAVSVNFVQGRPHTIRDANDESRAAGAYEFIYFQRLVPVARIGWSIYVYKVSDGT
jgi:hypothetical protein